MKKPSCSQRITKVLTVSCLAISGLGAQTVIKLPKNKYTPED